MVIYHKLLKQCWK